MSPDYTRRNFLKYRLLRCGACRCQRFLEAGGHASSSLFHFESRYLSNRIPNELKTTGHLRHDARLDSRKNCEVPRPTQRAHTLNPLDKIGRDTGFENIRRLPHSFCSWGLGSCPHFHSKCLG